MEMTVEKTEAVFKVPNARPFHDRSNASSIHKKPAHNLYIKACVQNLGRRLETGALFDVFTRSRSQCSCILTCNMEAPADDIELGPMICGRLGITQA